MCDVKIENKGMILCVRDKNEMIFSTSTVIHECGLKRYKSKASKMNFGSGISI